MKRNVAMAAMARPAASLALVAGLLAAPAMAGDRALLDILGYSPDGRYFAFEEFGVQDGSGFPYANVYLVDLSADAWVSGTPVRVVLDSEEARLRQARDLALERVAPTLERYMVEEPAHLIALNGDGEPGDGQTLEFGAVGYLPGDLRGSYRLVLEQYEAETSDDCALYLGEAAKGYALHLESEGGDRELHRDVGKLPRSRGCPMDYRIYGVVARPDSGSIANGVAIVSVYPFGFEGPDRRFLAVPLGQ